MKLFAQWKKPDFVAYVKEMRTKETAWSGLHGALSTEEVLGVAGWLYHHIYRPGSPLTEVEKAELFQVGRRIVQMHGRGEELLSLERLFRFFCNGIPHAHKNRCGATKPELFLP